MVNFSVFNDLSLPLKQHSIDEKFATFFRLLDAIKKKGLNQIRMSDNFKHYPILENISFQQFLGQHKDREFKTRLKGFVANTVINIDTPIIKADELTQSTQQERCEYTYHQQKTEGGLACCDIWGALAISFDSDEQWSQPFITLGKAEILNDEVIECEAQIKHAATIKHLDYHSGFFEQIALEKKLNITQANFWQNRTQSFPNLIVFCPEVETQIQSMDKIIFQQAMSILRDIETGRKSITDFGISGESETVRRSQKYRNARLFTLNGEKVFFQQHIKNLPGGYRIYFLESNERIHIGYIGKHLSSKKYK